MPLRCHRSSIVDDLFSLCKVNNFAKITSCDCGDPDLNEFFHTDAINYKSELLAETYALYLKGRSKIGPLALVALANDIIRLSKPQKRKLIHHKKRYIKEYPAVKIARLGVDQRFQNHGVGTYLTNLLKTLFTTNNRTGCRFLTVDAYNRPSVLAFYRKNEFDFLHDKDENALTRIMFYDLKRFIIS